MWLIASLAPLVLGATVEQPPSSGAARLASSEELRPWLPEPIWPHRELFFPVDRPLELAEKGSYSPPEAWHAATREYAEGVALGPEGQLEGYVAGTLITTEDGAMVPALSVAHVPGEVTVYDLSVGWPHTYFAAGILVHNKGR